MEERRRSKRTEMSSTLMVKRLDQGCRKIVLKS